MANHKHALKHHLTQMHCCKCCGVKSCMSMPYLLFLNQCVILYPDCAFLSEETNIFFYSNGIWLHCIHYSFFFFWKILKGAKYCVLVLYLSCSFDVTLCTYTATKYKREKKWNNFCKISHAWVHHLLQTFTSRWFLVFSILCKL